MARVTLLGWLVKRAIVLPLVCVSEDTHTRARGPRRSPPRRGHTHTLPHPWSQEKVIEVFFFSSEEKAPSIERMYSQTWENSSALSPPNYPQVAVLRGGSPHSFLPVPLFPSERPGSSQAKSLLLKPLPKTLFTACREKPGKRWWAGFLPPTPRVGDLRSLHLDFFLSPKKLESN